MTSSSLGLTPFHNLSKSSRMRRESSANLDIEIVDRMDIQCNLLAEHGPVEADNALARGEAAWVATAKGVEVIDLCEGEVAAVVVGA